MNETAAPAQAPQIPLLDIHGMAVRIGYGRKLLHSMFREASCPFCKFRVHDLTGNYPGLSGLRMHAMLGGMVGMRGMATGSLMPADFLLDEQGKIVETRSSEDAGDHIPMERIELFSVCGHAVRNPARASPLQAAESIQAAACRGVRSFRLYCLFPPWLV